MHIDYSTAIAYAFGLILIYIVGRVLLAPLRIVLKLVYNALIGGIILVILNFFGSHFGLSIAVNPITALIVGFLGVPGIIILFVVKYILSAG
ncbi:MAG: pro-sigmaK processing inhibitor BofA family protein [Tepidanaerobacteraceae bacterium]|jgi:inhibitor of the pro-sigma K processing machinery|nr:pro-sigmaK processing inhibitor BofA family protein [Tepidanaerobacteraceae bacterium]